MTRFTLPDDLGGRTVCVVGRIPNTDDVLTVTVEEPIRRLTVEYSALTEVTPPLPQEPPVGFYAAGSMVWQRDDEPRSEFRW